MEAEIILQEANRYILARQPEEALEVLAGENKDDPRIQMKQGHAFVGKAILEPDIRDKMLEKAVQKYSGVADSDALRKIEKHLSAFVIYRKGVTRHSYEWKDKQRRRREYLDQCSVDVRFSQLFLYDAKISREDTYISSINSTLGDDYLYNKGRPLWGLDKLIREVCLSEMPSSIGSKDRITDYRKIDFFQLHAKNYGEMSKKSFADLKIPTNQLDLHVKWGKLYDLGQLQIISPWFEKSYDKPDTRHDLSKRGVASFELYRWHNGTWTFGEYRNEALYKIREERLSLHPDLAKTFPDVKFFCDVFEELGRVGVHEVYRQLP